MAKKNEKNNDIVIVNTMDSITEIISSVVSNIKDENFKILTNSAKCKEKMNLRQDIHSADTILKSLDTMYKYEDNHMLDTTLFVNSVLTLEEFKYKKPLKVLKDLKDYNERVFQGYGSTVMSEMDKLANTYATRIVSTSTLEDGRVQYLLQATNLQKIDKECLQTLKGLVTIRVKQRLEQINHSKTIATKKYKSVATLNERLASTLSLFHGNDYREIYSENAIRYIIEILTSRYNIEKNPETDKKTKQSQLKELNKLVAELKTTAFVHSGSALFTAYYNYIVFKDIYDKLEYALANITYSKKSALQKELDTILLNLEKDFTSKDKAFRKCLNKNHLQLLEDSLANYEFSNENTIATTLVEKEEVEDIDNTIEEDYSNDTDTSVEYTSTIEENKSVNSRLFATAPVQNIESDDLPEFYENEEDNGEAEKDDKLKNIFSSLESLKKSRQDENITPSVNDINDTVVDNTSEYTPSVNSISSRLTKLNKLIKK